MSHAQIWDDSALIDTWNEALEEYRKYHSIHAKGELIHPEVPSNDDDEDLELTEQSGQAQETPKPSIHKTELDTAPTSTNNIASAPPEQVTAPPALPQRLVGSVQDEGLKKLLMSWYYAGYYTGLHEGQQQVTRNG